MICERILLDIDLEKLIAFFQLNIKPLPMAHGPALKGWSVLSSTGSYLDGFYDGTAKMKSNMTSEEGLQASKLMGGKDIKEYCLPTEICFGYIAEVIENIKKSGIECYRARIALMSPGKEAGWHIDAPASSYCVRLHVPLITNPLCFFETREGKVHMPADGSGYFVKVNCEHRAYNQGQTDRYHLIMNAFDRSGVSQYHRYDDWLKLQTKKVG